jgi:hypothetical protein
MILKPSVGQKAVEILVFRVRAQAWQLLKQITKVRPRFNTNMLASLNQTHQNRRPMTTHLTRNEKPALTTDGDWLGGAITMPSLLWLFTGLLKNRLAFLKRVLSALWAS